MEFRPVNVTMIFMVSTNLSSNILFNTFITRVAERIRPIIDEAVKISTLESTHFISLPLVIDPQLVDKLVTFQNTISKTSTLSGL
ncbi:hypothetical protein CTI12_AA501690 [Artemisia annua]|uniref:Uncharacterized protein n=1 Tax=Artemisia annua TaxID=35608 RepID=A0A2U1L8M8_ARTAN|nr:hypothetical protein CTI12_AA501690 [Artemisia annua]